MPREPRWLKLQRKHRTTGGTGYSLPFLCMAGKHRPATILNHIEENRELELHFSWCYDTRAPILMKRYPGSGHDGALFILEEMNLDPEFELEDGEAHKAVKEFLITDTTKKLCRNTPSRRGGAWRAFSDTEVAFIKELLGDNYPANGAKLVEGRLVFC